MHPSADDELQSSAGQAGACRPDGRQRDLFPLPLIERPSTTARSSRAGRRRAKCREGVESMVDAVVQCLNELHAGAEVSQQPQSSPTAGQVLALQHIHDCVCSMGKPPEDLTAEEALQAIQADSGYEGDALSLEPLDVGRLSLPGAGAQAVPLSVLLGVGGEERVREFVATKVVAKEEYGMKKAESSFRKPYMDPLLRDSRAYARFLGRLQQAGMIELVCPSSADFVEVGIFAVKKKSGAQRLIIDARDSNLYFRDPDHTSLCTASGMSQLQLQDQEQLYVGGVDIADAFYQMGLPAVLRRFFALREISVTSLVSEGVEVPSHLGKGKVRPVLTVLPMGWAHALAFCQEVHERALEELADMPRGSGLVDGSPAGKLAEGIHTEYVDNFISFSTIPQVADDLTQRAVRALEARGLRLHAAEPASSDSCQLG